MVCRNKERGEAAVSAIRSKTGSQNLHLEVVFLTLVWLDCFCFLTSENKMGLFG